jgi:hypothetical protein
MPPETLPVAGTRAGRRHQASQAGRLLHETRNLKLPVAPGVSDRRNALIRWAVLFEG